MRTVSATSLLLADGASHVRGLRGWIGLVRRWPALRRDLMSADGYVAHRVYFAGPTTIGLLTWWQSRKALIRFAHGAGHHEIWDWAVRRNTTKGGWLATYEMTGGGPLWGSGTPLSDVFADHIDPAGATPPRGCPAHHP